MFDVIKEILISEKEFTETNYKSLQRALVYVENNLIDSAGGMYLIVDNLIEINNIMAGANTINLRKVNLKPYGFHKMYMDKEVIEEKFYQIIHQFMKEILYLNSFIQYY